MNEQTSEIWKPVLGHEGRLEASSMGRVRALYIKDNWRTTIYDSPKIRKTWLDNKGYFRVSITRTLKRQLHCVVLEAFKGQRPKGFYGCHLNGNPKDNRIENLKWCSPSENQSHRKLHGTDKCGEKSHFAKLSLKKAKEIRLTFFNSATSIEDLAFHYNVMPSTINSVIKNKIWTKNAIKSNL